jgi:hypothetical protein
MNAKLVIPLVIAIASIIGIAYAIHNVIEKGDRAEIARRDAADARAEYEALTGYHAESTGDRITDKLSFYKSYIADKYGK